MAKQTPYNQPFPKNLKVDFKGLTQVEDEIYNLRIACSYTYLVGEGGTQNRFVIPQGTFLRDQQRLLKVQSVALYNLPAGILTALDHYVSIQSNSSVNLNVKQDISVEVFGTGAGGSTGTVAGAFERSNVVLPFTKANPILDSIDYLFVRGFTQIVLGLEPTQNVVDGSTLTFITDFTFKGFK